MAKAFLLLALTISYYLFLASPCFSMVLKVRYALKLRAVSKIEFHAHQHHPKTGVKGGEQAGGVYH